MLWPDPAAESGRRGLEEHKGDEKQRDGKVQVGRVSADIFGKSCSQETFELDEAKRGRA